MKSLLSKRAKGFEIVAHRGYQLLFPENTLIAFQKALDLGADGIEFDIQMSCDKVPIVIHDETVDRTTNGYGSVTAMNFRELKQLDAGSKFLRIYRGEKIPSLNEALQVIRGKGKAYIELKKSVSSSELERVLYEIYQCDMEKFVTIVSFNFEQLEMFHHLNASIPLGKLLLPDDFNLERMRKSNISLACAPYQAFLEIPHLLPLLKTNQLIPNANGITNRRIAKYLLQNGVNIFGCDMAL